MYLHARIGLKREILVARSLCFLYRVNLSATNDAKFMLLDVDSAMSVIRINFTYAICCWVIDELWLCIASGCSPNVTMREKIQLKSCP